VFLFNRRRDDDLLPEPENPLETFDLGTLREAEDGSEILFALGRVLEANGAAPGYVAQVRTAANAVRDLTDLHPDHGTSERDGVFGAAEHASELRHQLLSRQAGGAR
jgi:hypothetical protein